MKMETCGFIMVLASKTISKLNISLKYISYLVMQYSLVVLDNRAQDFRTGFL